MRLLVLSLTLYTAACSRGAAANPNGEVAKLVVSDLASNAFGNQKVAASCVTVAPTAKAGKATVAAARLRDDAKCGDATARGLLWVFVREGSKAWSEEFLGGAPECWKGLPSELAPAIAQASKIPQCS
jgi:hypothetical protein